MTLPEPWFDDEDKRLADTACRLCLFFDLCCAKPLLLDLFCGAGGAARGYQRAGFEVWGCDIEPQPRYAGDLFFQMDAFEFLSLFGFLADAIHASPPCQKYSRLNALHGKAYPDLVAATRDALTQTGKPYVIENVPGAPLHNPLVLCGTMFGLRVIRHRLFECNPPVYFAPSTCRHWAPASGNKSMKAARRVTPNLSDFDILTVTGHDFILADARVAMGIDWMDQKTISQAIPPAYTEYIGRQLMPVVMRRLAVAA